MKLDISTITTARTVLSRKGRYVKLKVARVTNGTAVSVGHTFPGFYFLQVTRGKKSFAEFEPFNQMNNAEFVEVDLV